MPRIVLDTDVASLIIKQRLPASLAVKLVGSQSVITFVTLAELTNGRLCGTGVLLGARRSTAG